jgi:hypothetical protein
MVMATDSMAERSKALQALGDDLATKGFKVRLVQPVKADPFLRVTSPATCDFSENITARPERGNLTFLYSWGDPIGPASGVAAAAERVAYVLSPQDAV